MAKSYCEFEGEIFLRHCLIAVAATMLTAPAVAAPGDVNADTFYRKAKGLMAKGPLALMSADIKPMKAQLGDATKRVRAENHAAKERGKPIYCPPERGSVGPKFLIDGLGAIPEARRRQMTLAEGWRQILVDKYPCA